ncbi:hypothetical protein SAMN06296273_2475 [Nitrosomonas ureae]|uniref:Uncharacterized protein n=1 Tax=Nitrosomonas ureae TaxID=44577 RepID=A0A285C0B4_9PROT|nr:hypothetical protein [Nitrosomonas ureae]SNX61017.1 hypothetical protein SAMN06296273_2475 [Nitrosomonas ureae]
MSAARGGKASSRVEDAITVRSDKLKELRVVVSYWKEFSAVISSAA